jgi:quercetin dioxygenase-like cupin family protein
MISERLQDMTKGWFVGSFNPTALSTDACEVAVKKYQAGDYEPAHFHKIATEVTLILSGSVYMAGKTFEAGDIIVLQPNEITDFRAVTDVATVVVKVPGAKNDKYLVDV